MTYGFWTETLQWTLAAVGVWLMSGTAMNFSTSPNWYVRGWDFPRIFVALLALVVGGAWAWLCAWHWWDDAFLVGISAVAGVQVWNIYPYTPLGGQQVKRAGRGDPDAARPDRSPSTLRMVATNVLMENDEHEKWRRVVTAADPDLILAVEVNDALARGDAAAGKGLPPRRRRAPREPLRHGAAQPPAAGRAAHPTRRAGRHAVDPRGRADARRHPGPPLRPAPQPARAAGQSGLARPATRNW